MNESYPHDLTSSYSNVDLCTINAHVQSYDEWELFEGRRTGDGQKQKREMEKNKAGSKYIMFYWVTRYSIYDYWFPAASACSLRAARLASFLALFSSAGVIVDSSGGSIGVDFGFGGCCPTTGCGMAGFS